MGSSYPNRFNHVTIGGVPVVNTHPGEVFWVNGSSVLAKGGVSGSDGNDGSYTRPFATIEGALNNTNVKASRGDIIFVMPGHTETVSAAGGIALDKAGVAVVGLGVGTLRPTITLDTAATASVTVTAASVTVSNVLFKANFADITRMINVTATDFHLDNCEFLATAANMNWVDVIDCSGADNTADGLRVTNVKAYDLDASNDSFIEITGDLNRLHVENCHVVHDHANATALIECATGKDLTNCYVVGNHYDSLKASGDILIDNATTANSGVVKDNSASHADTAGEVLVDADGVALINNYATGVITASGYILPAVDS
jgi:hypothetical protein